MIRDHVNIRAFNTDSYPEIWNFVWDRTKQTFPEDVVNYVNDRTFIIGTRQFPTNHIMIVRKIRENLGEYKYD